MAEHVDKSANSSISPTVGKMAIALQQSGPLPSASEMYGYSQIDPSFPDRIFRLAEKEQENNAHQKNELIAYHNRKELHDYNLDRLALSVCFILCLVFIAASVYLFAKGVPVGGAFFLCASVFSFPKFFWARKK